MLLDWRLPLRTVINILLLRCRLRLLRRRLVMLYRLLGCRLLMLY